MIIFADFLANNYLWFLVISIFLIFSLIGYFVDQDEQKKGISTIVGNHKKDLDIHELAEHAENKTLNNAVIDAVKKSQETLNMNENNPSSNTIIDQTLSQTANNLNQIGFEVLKK